MNILFLPFFPVSFRSVLGDVQQKTAVIYSRGDSGGGKDGPGFLDHEIKDKLNQLTHDVKAIRSNPQVSLGTT